MLMLLHTSLSSNQPGDYKDVLRLWSEFRVEEWLQIQPNTPYKLSTCTDMSWGVTYGLVKDNSRNNSVDASPPAAESPRSYHTGFKCCGCDLPVTKVTAGPVLYPGETQDESARLSPQHPYNNVLLTPRLSSHERISQTCFRYFK